MNDQTVTDPIPLIACLVMLFAYHAATEARYLLHGKTAPARVTATTACVRQGRYGRSYRTVAVDYQFTDTDGSLRLEQDLQSSTESVPAVGQSLDVEFCPGELFESRIAGHSHPWEILLAGVLMAGTVGGAVIYYTRLPSDERSAIRFDVLAD